MPVTGQNPPKEQLKQTLNPVVLLNAPMEQGSENVILEVGQYPPEEQAKHTLRPVMLAKVPMGQLLNEFMPGDPQKEPTGAGKHVEYPFPGAYRPRAQDKHAFAAVVTDVAEPKVPEE
jgi:hypothetical protein